MQLYAMLGKTWLNKAEPKHDLAEQQVEVWG